MRTNRNRNSYRPGSTDELFIEYAKSRDPAIRKQLIDAHRGLVCYLAGKFANRGEPLDDLIAVGYIGLVNAVDRFDPARGARFSTFATPTIIGEIRRYFRDKSWRLKVPRRLQELNQMVAKASETLSSQLGRNPTPAEIAVYLGVDEEDALAALELASVHDPISVDSSAQGWQDKRLTSQDSYGVVDGAFEKVESSDDLARALDKLADREREVLYLRFFNELSQDEVAKRLKISQMHVSRLQNKALKRLRRLLEV